jgi:predicted lipoprotein with Yx(FWY)xxD motif
MPCRNYAHEKTKKGDRYRIAMGHGRSPPRRGSPRGAWLWIVLRQRKRKIQQLIGIQGGFPPLELPPPRGRERVTLAISSPPQKTRKGSILSRIKKKKERLPYSLIWFSVSFYLLKTTKRVILKRKEFYATLKVMTLKNRILFILILVVISTIVITGCTQQQAAQPTPPQTTQPAPVSSAETIGTADSSLGIILVDAEGMTLYYFAKDVPASGTSSCYGQCEVAWPVFSADPVTVSSPLDPADFGTITRTDGTKQTTYHGWPLYYFQADTKPGDVKGENVGNNWFVFNPDESVLIAQNTDLGFYLTDTTGKTLYFFTKDTTGTSTCTGSCLAKWPAFSADPVSAPSVLKPSDFSSITRSDGVKQTAFMGRPLYYFADDVKPGEVKGQGFNDVWYIANISGTVPAVTPNPTTIPTTIRTTSYYGGGY